MGLLIERFCSHFPFLSSLFPVSHFPFPVPVPVLIFLSSFQLKKIIRSCGYCFFQRQMKLIYVNRNLGFSMRGDVFVFLCDCRQTRCRWGEIKDKGASLFLNSIIFYPKGQETSGLQVSVWNRSQTPALIVKRKVRIFNQKVIFSNFFF